MTHADGAGWYYLEGSERRGPFGVQDMQGMLRAGGLRGETLVWTAGMSGWAPLAQTALGQVPPAAPFPGEPQPAAAPYGAAPHGAGPQGGAAGSGAPPVQGMRAAVRSVLTQYATFRGRANRPEFWWFMLAQFVLLVGTAILDVMLFGLETWMPLNTLTSLALLLPSLAVSARRLHDTDRSAWWMLIGFVPLVGAIVLLVFACQRGTPGPNRFG